MESSDLLRGVQLYELGRYQDAVTYFAKDLKNWESRFYLAQSYYMLSEYKKAADLAEGLLSESPNDQDVFYLKARIALQQDQEQEALQNINEAISIDPYDSNYFGFKAAILLQLKKYEEGLENANEGLHIDPKNSFCLNIRAQLLTKLNRVSEAGHTIEDILFENPEDSYSHANVGWVALENNKIDTALSHFKEALQIDPNYQYAREGMSTALKAKNFIYRNYLKYSFWISKQSTKNQWGILIGIYLVYRFSFKFLSANGLTYLAIPLLIAYLLFALGSWIMEPMSNAILGFNSYGKYLLSTKEQLSGYFFTGLITLGLLSILVFYTLKIDYFLPLAIASLSALIPLPRAFLEYSKKARYFGISVGALIICIGLFGFLFTSSIATIAGVAFLIMVIFTWTANIFK